MGGLMSTTEVLSLVRRYATAIAEGRIAAKVIADMTDEELLEFEQSKFGELDAKQKEAEDLAKEGQKNG